MMFQSDQISFNGNRFYPADEKHTEYIRTILVRARDGIPKPKTGEFLPKITDDDVALIQEFTTEIQATVHITVKRAYKYTYILVHWREYIGEFRKNTIADLYLGITSLQNAKDATGSPCHSRHTLADYVGFLKKFYLWLSENGYTTIEEKKIRKIKPPAIPQMTKTAEMLITEEDVRRMIEVCQNSRDRAIIAMMYEGGFRIGELASLKWQQVKFNEWNLAVNVDNKTRKPRYIPLVMARSYLAQWRNDYPLPITESGYVFVTAGKHQQLQYQGFVKQLDKIVKRAGIRKHVSPHIFRHSRITHLIQKGFGDSKIKLMMWGSIDSDMFKAYAHLTNADIDAAVARDAGIVMPAEQKKTESLAPRQCPRCYSINSPTQQFCGSCGADLTEEAKVELQSANQQLDDYLQTPEGINAAIKALHRIQKERTDKAIS